MIRSLIKQKSFKLILLSIAPVLLASCGSVSELTTTGQPIDKKYTQVVVKDFSSTVSESNQMSQSSKQAFPDKIAKQLQNTGKFKSVSRNTKPSANTLIIDGNVSRYEEGNSLARLFIGLGMGSSYLDSTVQFKDGATGKTIGTISVDKNSWIMGGFIAAGQTPDTFMREASVKIAKEAGNLAL